MASRNVRFSILDMMALVLVLAADFGLLRFVAETTFPLAVMVLPLLNFMIWGLWTSRRRLEGRLYWFGFEAAGLALLILMASMRLVAADTLISPTVWLIEHHWISGSNPERFPFGIGVITATYALPQLLVASAVGWFSSRFRVVIERRPRLGGLDERETPIYPRASRRIPVRAAD